jgi:hypothetical protein
VHGTTTVDGIATTVAVRVFGAAWRPVERYGEDIPVEDIGRDVREVFAAGRFTCPFTARPVWQSSRAFPSGRARSAFVQTGVQHDNAYSTLAQGVGRQAREIETQMVASGLGYGLRDHARLENGIAARVTATARRLPRSRPGPPPPPVCTACRSRARLVGATGLARGRPPHRRPVEVIAAHEGTEDEQLRAQRGERRGQPPLVLCQVEVREGANEPEIRQYPGISIVSRVCDLAAE